MAVVGGFVDMRHVVEMPKTGQANISGVFLPQVGHDASNPTFGQISRNFCPVGAAIGVKPHVAVVCTHPQNIAIERRCGYG